jgi:hypothetical protein
MSSIRIASFLVAIKFIIIFILIENIYYNK